MIDRALVEVPADISFTKFASAKGWGDGLPLVPPTEERVAAHVSASGLDAQSVLVHLPPKGAPCTVQRLAANAVMAGAPEAAMPLLMTALRAMAESDFDLPSLSTTTASVLPGVIVNGQIRHSLGIPFAEGCLGGVAGSAPAIGRALRLVLRNVGGQRIGDTSKSVFGSPARVCGIVFGEWEERSPWEPFARRRGIAGNAVTVYGAMGTANVLDVSATKAKSLLEIIGKSLVYPGVSGFARTSAFSEVMLCLNPIWAERIAAEITNIDDVLDILWRQASLPVDWWPSEHREALASVGRVASDNRVYLVERPDQIHLIVCGGLGGLHAAPIHSFGPTAAITLSVEGSNTP